MVSTMIDGIFGNDDTLPFDIKQTCRMIFDGAGMIVFKHEWEDNCLNMLAKVTGDNHPLRNLSLQRLMGKDPQMVSPQAQAQGLRASEVAATTRAAREAICAACRIIAKLAQWSTIKQSEGKSFTQFVDHLQAAVDASDLPAEAKGPVVAGCLQQQCNQATKEILRSVPPGASIAAMVKHVAREENLAPVQATVGASLAPIPAAVGAAVAEVMAVQNYGDHNQPASLGPPSQGRPRGPCWACGKKGHIARECGSKKQGNGRGRGQMGHVQPSPSWDIRRASYSNPAWSEHLPNPHPPREATNFMAQPLPLQQVCPQPMTQPKLTTSVSSKGNLESKTFEWP
ncbi:hypothetical protein TURU_092645 [Turdus rufiventris]|nr:hypothetical protein TURU_092645 [Turdus rufiventris]